MSSQLETLARFEAKVVRVDDDGTIYAVSSTEGFEGDHTLPPLASGTSGAGFFLGKGGSGVSVNDWLLLGRSPGGTFGETQIIRVLPSWRRLLPTSVGAGENRRIRAGTMPYPITNMNDGDVKVVGSGGGSLHLMGPSGGLQSEVFLGNELSAGLYVTNYGKMTHLSSVSHTYQSLSTGHRMFSGDIYRGAESSGDESVSSSGLVPHELACDIRPPGKRRGLFPGCEAAETAYAGNIRNPAIPQYRIVINSVSETSMYKGMDKEAALANKKAPMRFDEEKELRAISSSNSLHLEPFQLIEIIGGNVVNSRGELLDPNYNVIKIGDATGMPVKPSVKEYEKYRILTSRSLGYHFQVATNSVSSKTGNDVDNFTFGIDKEGVMKLNVPKSSNAGNILYPTNASFYKSGSGAIKSSPDESNIGDEEDIPVLLRKKSGEPVLPSGISGKLDSETYKRKTGVRYSNTHGYFQGSVRKSGANNVRINPTKHHNMYAAAEMLIANTVRRLVVPFKTTKCDAVIKGNPSGEPFERFTKNLDAAGIDKELEQDFMTVAAVRPGPPAINSGGGVVVCGVDRTVESTLGNSEKVNFPFSNSFTVNQGEGGELGSSVSDGTGNMRGESGGRSANLNFEGSLEVSLGKDNSDGKSLLLDTAGGVVAWYGSDKAGRSLVVQTDGDVALNVGCPHRTGRKGRFDLRVNVVNKGNMENNRESNPADGTEGKSSPAPNHASDFIISISDAGLVIAGMSQDIPMVIRNDGQISIESSSKLILAGNKIEMREGNTPAKATGGKDESKDTPGATIEEIPEIISCLSDLIADAMSDE